MANLKKMFLMLVTVAFLAGAFLTGCGGGIDEEQWQELQDLDAKIQQLQSDKSNKENDKKKIQSQINQKDDQLKKLQKDIDLIKNCK